MSKPPRKEGGKAAPPRGEVVRRAASERRRLPPNLEAFAAGDDDAIWRRPAKHRLNDPRPVVLVPGVANRDARAVYEARERRIRAALEGGDEDRAAMELAEASRMRVWRGHSLVGWEVFVENVLGIAPERARELLGRGEAIVGGTEPPSEDVVATWMRAEAGLLEASPSAAVRLRTDGDGERLVLEVAVADAAAALTAVGRRAAPLARERANAPQNVVDRPKGVARLSRLERDPGEDD